MLHRSVSHLIELKLLDNERLGYHHKVPCSIIAEFYAGALLSAAIWWLENDTAISIDDMVLYISLLINEKATWLKNDRGSESPY
jgi:hypothetical protein